MSALPPKADIGTLHVYHLRRSNSGGVAIFAAIRRALPFVSISLAAEPPWLILGPHKQVAICCLNITLNGGKLLLRNRATTIWNTASGQMEAIMRAYIVIGTLAVLAVSARIYTAHTQDRLIAGLNCTVDCSGYNAGYKWAKQRDIDDDDYCPDGNKSFYEGCAAYAVGSSGAANETDSGIGTPLPLSNDDDNDDDKLR